MRLPAQQQQEQWPCVRGQQCAATHGIITQRGAAVSMSTSAPCEEVSTLGPVGPGEKRLKSAVHQKQKQKDINHGAGRNKNTEILLNRFYICIHEY